MHCDKIKQMKRIIVLLVLLLPLAAFAQYSPFQRTVTMEAIPKFPKEYSTANVSVQTYSFDVSRAETVWRLNGKIIKQGIGISEIDIETKGAGEKMLVDFTATLNGETIKKSIDITPHAIDMIIEADTYTPKQYRGRSLPITDSDMRVIAVPNITLNGKTYTDDELIFSWKEDDQYIQSASGVGRSIFNVKSPKVFRTKDISVEITSLDKRIDAGNSISIKAQNPKVLLYEQNPLQGVLYQKAITNSATLNNDEIILVAEPYFFPGRNRDSVAATYTWELNNKDVQTGDSDPGKITLRQAGQGQGNVSVGVTVLGTLTQLQNAEYKVKFLFGKKNNSLGL